MKDNIYFAPTRVSEALELLAEYSEQATVLAGGTDLVHRINYHELSPEVLVYIGGLGLDYVKEGDGELLIGAMTTIARLAANELVAQKASALAEAARQCSSVAIRTSATIGGNLANASPAADMAPPLLVMDARLHLLSTSEKRVVAANDFFVGPGKTVLKPHELIIEVHVPLPKGKTIFLKLGRRKAQTLSLISVAVRLDMDGMVCKDARIALGSVAPTPLRCNKAEGLIKGKVLGKGLIAACAAQALAESNPIDDQRGTAWYRKKAGTALVARALVKAAGIGG
jgi:CO/xanthine dehydrogenase FAD-binding subunit